MNYPLEGITVMDFGQAVFGPTCGRLLAQLGAEVIKVSGQRDIVTDEAKKYEMRKFYVGHILHPFFRDGIRSLAYEIVEQLDWCAPQRIYLPVSAGTLLLGVISGF